MRASLALSMLVLTACDLGTNAIDVTLVPNPELTTVADLRAHVETLVFIIDNPSGSLYPLGRESTNGYTSIENADTDPSDLELVIRVPFDRAFPEIRIEEGGLPLAKVSLKVLGLTSDGVTYAEGTTQLTFRSGIHSRNVPFDVDPKHQPPRVGALQLVPNPPCGAPSLLVLFSSPIDPATALTSMGIRFEPGGLPRNVTIEASGWNAYIGVPLAALEVSRYSVTIGPGIETRDDVAFDQIPATEAHESFFLSFASPCR